VFRKRLPGQSQAPDAIRLLVVHGQVLFFAGCAEELESREVQRLMKEREDLQRRMEEQARRAEKEARERPRPAFIPPAF